MQKQFQSCVIIIIEHCISTNMSVHWCVTFNFNRLHNKTSREIVTSCIIHVLVFGNPIQHYVIKFVSDLRQVGGFLRVLRFPPPIKLTPQYNCNIVESGVTHPSPNPVFNNQKYDIQFYKYTIVK